MKTTLHISKRAPLGLAMFSWLLVSAASAEVYDTTFAVEYSYACTSCHAADTQLMDEYTQSAMTHAMVKCNACHGTHTEETVGKEKPNLTGYHPGIGATGYVVGKDRCLVCHSAALTQNQHPNNPSECLSCHAPHVFSAGGNGN